MSNEARIRHHEVDAVNEQFIRVSREEGRGAPCNAAYKYRIYVVGDARDNEFDLTFHRGPVAGLRGANGLTIEALLAVCMDRLECFQRGPARSRHTAMALTKIEEALMCLGARSADRERRGVTGKTEP